MRRENLRMYLGVAHKSGHEILLEWLAALVVRYFRFILDTIPADFEVGDTPQVTASAA
jgi:hypothetical protein